MPTTNARSPRARPPEKRCDASSAASRPGSTASSTTITSDASPRGNLPLDTQRRPFEAEAANLFFQLVSSRYEQASLIVTSNKPFGRWGEVFGDDVVAAAMIDRLVHHAEVVSLKGDSYRLKDRDLGRVPAAGKTDD